MSETLSARRRRDATKPLKGGLGMSGRPSIHYERGFEDGWLSRPCAADAGPRERAGWRDGVEANAERVRIRRTKTENGRPKYQVPERHILDSMQTWGALGETGDIETYDTDSA